MNRLESFVRKLEKKAGFSNTCITITKPKRNQSMDPPTLYISELLTSITDDDVLEQIGVRHFLCFD